MLNAKDFIALTDFSGDQILEVLNLADTLKRRLKAGEIGHGLDGKTIALIFEKPSLRTRITFQTGIFQLGGHSVIIDTKLGKRESVPDVARNLERWVDGIVARTFSHDHVLELAQYASVPVVNALTDLLHPCQILADAQALREHRGADFGSMKLVFVGDGNNVFNSWANFAAQLPLNLTLVCPEGYEPDQRVFNKAKETAAGELAITSDIESGVRDADAVYTDVWASMGQEDEAQEREKVFAPYQVNRKLMDFAKPDALFMHCLPAHRGSEVTDEIMDDARSIVFDQAENRLHAQKAVLTMLIHQAA
jgi:ornithine carbamoyltransferase